MINRIFPILFFSLIGLSLSTAQMTEKAAMLGIDRVFGIGEFAGGVSFVDFNGDGWDDLTMATQTGDSILFYVNNQGTGFTRLIPSLVGHTGFSKQVLWVDTDNDGDLDLFVTTHSGQNKLYENTGNLTFTDITTTCGIKLQNDVTYGANFGDIDQDGDLDLYVQNREFVYGNYLYRNDGNNTFVDITLTSGLNTSKEADFCSAFFDYDNDFDLDLYVIVDKYVFHNYLFDNNGSGFFTDVSSSSGAGIYIDAMNAGIGDYNGDGFEDIYVTNTDAGSVLLQNMGDGTFTDVTAASGAGIGTGSHWAGCFFDLENDKDLDLYVCSEFPNSTYPNRLFENNGDSTFTEMPAGGLPGDTLSSYACATGDYNNDGLLDILVGNNLNNPFQLWENQDSSGNKFFRLKLSGTTSNSYGIGSRIELYTGAQKQIRTVFAAINYLGQNSLTQHFGLGDQGFVDSLIIYWPSGSVDKHFCLNSNTTYQATEAGSITDLNMADMVNTWLGGSGSFDDPAKWSLGHVPEINEMVILTSPDNSSISITNPPGGVYTLQNIEIEANVSFTNLGTLTLSNNGGQGLSLLPNSTVLNQGSINISNKCDHAIVVSGILTNEGTIMISGLLKKEPVKVLGGGLFHSKNGALVSVDPD